MTYCSNNILTYGS